MLSVLEMAYTNDKHDNFKEQFSNENHSLSLSLSLCECLFQTPVACCTGQPTAPGIQQLDNIDMYLGSIAGMRQEKVRGVSSIVIWSMIYRDHILHTRIHVHRHV